MSSLNDSSPNKLENEPISHSNVIIERAIIDMLAGVSQDGEMGLVPSGVTSEQTNAWLMYPENESKITEQNDRLIKNHTEFIQKYDSIKNSVEKKNFRESYENNLDYIVKCRITLLKHAAAAHPNNAEHIEGLILIPNVIIDWLDRDDWENEDKNIKSGGRRRKTNKVRKSKMRVFRRRSSKSKKSRKSRKYVR